MYYNAKIITDDMHTTWVFPQWLIIEDVAVSRNGYLSEWVSFYQTQKPMVRRALDKLGVRSFQQASRISVSSLLEMNGIGTTTVREFQRRLARHGVII